ncbi:hypothetical protein E2C01_009508 [Portunus trituberculatus]|uniref:Uncharacterized protein n=1 Tax=Portunus trituberculatus TaxID=210409 RepID=A0A5B7D5Z6_PORTR|nr:hypothetical protein [Portunus trituberculatus]
MNTGCDIPSLLRVCLDANALFADAPDARRHRTAPRTAPDAHRSSVLLTRSLHRALMNTLQQPPMSRFVESLPTPPPTDRFSASNV